MLLDSTLANETEIDLLPMKITLQRGIDPVLYQRTSRLALIYHIYPQSSRTADRSKPVFPSRSATTSYFCGDRLNCQRPGQSVRLVQRRVLSNASPDRVSVRRWTHDPDHGPARRH
ncbi:hypothetical protein BST61_g1768 [Cercospora zeina]